MKLIQYESQELLVKTSQLDCSIFHRLGKDCYKTADMSDCRLEFKRICRFDRCSKSGAVFGFKAFSFVKNHE